MSRSPSHRQASPLDPPAFFAADPPERAAEYFRLAVRLVSEHKTSLQPLNIALFYFQSAGVSEALNAAIATQLPNDKAWDHQTAVKLFQRYLAPCLDVSVAELQKAILEIVDDTVTVVTSAADASDLHVEGLGQRVDRMSTCQDMRQLMAHAGEILAEARTLAAETRGLSATLRTTAEDMQQLREELSLARQRASVDALTGLQNRYVFDTTLAELVAGDRPFALIMFDIDHFKSINDLHGHLIGDQVLKQVAKVVQSQTRVSDTIARYGGEEFAVLLPNTPLSDARRIAEKLRQSVDGICMRRRDTGEAIGSVTASFGVAEFQRGLTADELVAAADSALYVAKRAGRNRVESGPSNR